MTFLAARCQIVVGRDAGTFDVALAGALNRTNRRAVGEVLEVIVAQADTMRLSLRRLNELDDAGAALLNNIADIASRSHVTWLVVDGSLMWQGALDRVTSNATVVSWYHRPTNASRHCQEAPSTLEDPANQMTAHDSPPDVDAQTSDDADRVADGGEATPTRLDIRIDRPLVVHLSGELDIDSAPRLSEVLQPLARPGGTIELGVTELTFIDSSGIHVLCHTVDRLGPRGRLVVSHPTTAVRRALELTGLTDLIDLIDTDHDRSIANRPT